MLIWDDAVMIAPDAPVAQADAPFPDTSSFIDAIAEGELPMTEEAVRMISVAVIANIFLSTSHDRSRT